MPARGNDPLSLRAPAVPLALSALFTLLALSAAGCAYFNTFHHAKRFYADAEAVRLKTPDGVAPPQTFEVYDKCMKKCAKVLTEYEDSRWVDDALLLMGKCSLRRGEYSQAIRKFGELAEFYPKSDLLPEARFQTGVARLREGDAAGAASAMAVVLDDPQAKAFHSDALAALGMAQAQIGDSAAAIGAFERFLAENGDHPSRTHVAQTLAKIHLARGEPARARAAYERIRAKPRGEWEIFRDTRIDVGRALVLEGELDEARRSFRDLLRLCKRSDDSADVYVEEARIDVVEGNDSLAIGFFSRVPVRYPRSRGAARALYERGVLLFDRFGDLRWAKTSFDSVQVHASDLPEHASARVRSSMIGARIALDEALVARLQRVEAAASAPEAPDSAAADAADSSAAVPDTTTADSVAVRAAATDTAAALTEVEYLAALGDTGLARLFALADSAARDEIAATYIEIGQTELLKLSRVTEAVAAYARVDSQFPDSRQVPQALLALAWIHENRMGDRSEAERLYWRVLREHGASVQARGAAEGLGMELAEADPPPPDTLALLTQAAAAVAAAAARDSARAAQAAEAAHEAERAAREAAGGARAESLRAALPTPDLAASTAAGDGPRVLAAATPNYPPDLAERGLVGSVEVEVTVGPAGGPIDARVLRSDNPDLDGYAVEAALRSVFTPPAASHVATIVFRFPPDAAAPIDPTGPPDRLRRSDRFVPPDSSALWGPD